MKVVGSIIYAMIVGGLLYGSSFMYMVLWVLAFIEGVNKDLMESIWMIFHNHNNNYDGPNLCWQSSRLSSNILDISMSFPNFMQIFEEIS